MTIAHRRPPSGAGSLRFRGPYNRDMHAQTDLIVAGAGYAGLVCARAAAGGGARVTVVERKPAPGVRPHTTGILVKEAHACLDAPGSCLRRIDGVRLYAPSLRHVDLTSPGYYFMAADTPGLMRWLADQARAAGADIRFSTSFRNACRDDGLIELPDIGLRGRYLVGADGAQSEVARVFGLGRNHRFLIGTELEMTGVRGLDPDVLHVFLDSRLAPGYIGWALQGVGMTQVGLAASHPAKLDLDGLLAKLGRCFDFDRACVIGRRGGLIPAGGRVRDCSAPGVLLLGDAAGTVSPLTAGGIHRALELGEEAGGRIAGWLRQGGPDPGWELARAYPRYFWKRQMRALAGMAPPNPLLDALFATPGFARLARLIFFHNRGLLSWSAWRDLLGLRADG